MRLNDLVVAAGDEAMLRGCGLDSLDALFAARGAASLDKPGLASWRTRERIELDGGARTAGADGALGTHPTAEWTGACVTLYLKRYSSPPAAAVRAVRRGDHGARSLAGVEWNLMQQLRERGIPCPMGVALGEKFRAGREVRSAVLARAVPGRSLEQLFSAGALDRRTIRQVLDSTARLVAKFHGCGWVHRDLYLAHLFFDPAETPERRLHIIDLQRVMRPRCCRNRWIVKDLASLNYSAPHGVVSRSDRVRWLRTYLGLARLGVSGKVLAYRVAGKSQQIARHDQRRRLRLAGHGGDAL